MMIFKDTPKAYLYFLFNNIWLFALFILFTGKESLQKIKPNALMLKKNKQLCNPYFPPPLYMLLLWSEIGSCINHRLVKALTKGTPKLKKPCCSTLLCIMDLVKIYVCSGESFSLRMWQTKVAPGVKLPPSLRSRNITETLMNSSLLLPGGWLLRWSWWAGSVWCEVRRHAKLTKVCKRMRFSASCADSAPLGFLSQ